MSSLRWIERDGKMVLEMGRLRHPITPEHNCNCWEWTDVPTHQEPNHCEYGNCWKCRENAAWDKAKKAQEPKKDKVWSNATITATSCGCSTTTTDESYSITYCLKHEPKVTFSEPKKVTVEDGLAECIRHLPISASFSNSVAKAAIEFFKERLKTSISSGRKVLGYEEVAIALFGEA